MYPCEHTAVVIVAPDGEPKPLCAKHFKHFTNYYEDAIEKRTAIQHL